jgi:subtilisin family serine protease
MRFRRSVCTLAALSLGLSACSPDSPGITEPLSSAARSVDAVATGGAVVVFESETSIPQAGLDLIALLGGTVTSRHDAIGVLFATGLTAAALETLNASDLVAGAGPDYSVNWLPNVVVGDAVGLDDDATPNTHNPERASRLTSWQWGPQRIAATDAWRAGYRGDPVVKVAILDTGIDALHRELRGLVDINLSRSFVPEEPTFDDLHFHGTHVASTVSTNSVTVAGIAPHITLVAVKVLSFLGSGTFEGVINGIMYASDIRSNVINMSLGAEFDRRLEGAKELIEAMRRSVQYAAKKNTLVISAAGNSSINLDDAGAPIVALPCMVSHMCVSATGPLNGQFNASGPILTENHDQPAYYTNYGLSAITVAAPGGNANPDDPDRSQGTWRVEDLIAGACAGRSTVIPQCAVNNDLVAFYVFAGGTSMATPHVSGAAALIASQYGGLISYSALLDRLTTYADDILEPGADVYSNNGRINVFRAIQGQ